MCLYNKPKKKLEIHSEKLPKITKIYKIKKASLNFWAMLVLFPKNNYILRVLLCLFRQEAYNITFA